MLVCLHPKILILCPNYINGNIGIDQTLGYISDLNKIMYCFHVRVRVAAGHTDKVPLWWGAGEGYPGSCWSVALSSLRCRLHLFAWLEVAHHPIWRRQWHSTPVLLPGKSHGWRTLVGCSPWGCEESVGHDWATSLFTFLHWRRKWQPTPVFLPGESQGQRSLMSCLLWGRRESDTTDMT